MLIHWIWFAQLPGISQRQKASLLQRGSEPEELFYASKRTLEQLPWLDPSCVAPLTNKDLTQAEQIENTCRRKHIRIITQKEDDFPSRLRNISDAPVLLYCMGRIPDFSSQPVIAVVGTRKSTPYGMTTARKMAKQICQGGGMVISGGARGIDTSAMEGALEAGGKTVAVLGCGVDRSYPTCNRNLFVTVAENGCLLSEYPPGTPPSPWNFPQRNRILSGIANGVLVVEAPRSSGALITARDALEQGRDVFSVPANIDYVSCEGSNALLQEGAQPVMSGWDVLREYAPMYPGVVMDRSSQGMESTAPAPAVAEEPADKKSVDNPATLSYSGVEHYNAPLSQEEQRLLSCLDRHPVAVDELICRVDMPAGTVLRLLTGLSLKGLVQNHPGRRVSASPQNQ